MPTALDHIRTEIVTKIRDLRIARRWTQAELAARLELSQGRVSQIESGSGSFTAEQLLVALQLFNVSVDHFYSGKLTTDRGAILQNALARLGASHLAEVADTPPSADLASPEDVITESLSTATAPRQITALAPVLVAQGGALFGLLRRLKVRLTELGLERRLAWAVENTNDALRGELATKLPRDWAQRYRRTNIVVADFLKEARLRRQSAARDILDADIRTEKTADQVQEASSKISIAWGIVTSIQPEDFRQALKASRGTD